MKKIALSFILMFSLNNTLFANTTQIQNNQELLTGKKDVDELIFKLIKVKESLETLEEQKNNILLKKKTDEQLKKEAELKEQFAYDKEKRENIKSLERLENKIQMDNRKKLLDDKNDIIVSEKIENIRLLIDYNLLQIKHLKSNITTSFKLKIKSSISFGKEKNYTIDEDEYNEKIELLLNNKKKLDNLNNKQNELLLLSSIVTNKVLLKKELEKINLLSKSKTYLENEMESENSNLNSNTGRSNNTQSYRQLNQQSSVGTNIKEKNYIFIKDIEENSEVKTTLYKKFLLLELIKI